jgi:GNAT superfamily N-acetyltransferase
LTTWGERLAHEHRSEGVRAFTADRDASAQDLLRSRGYVQVRSSFTMRKDLEAGEDPGTPPPRVSIRRYEDADERVLFELDQASFAEHWGFRPTSFKSFNQELHGEDWDPSLVFLADAGEETVGYVVPFLFETCGYVGSLGVLEEWRGRGIGKALLRRSFAELAGPRHAGGQARRGHAERPRRRRLVRGCGHGDSTVRKLLLDSRWAK